MKNKIIFNIAGFHIRINFCPTEWGFARSKIDADIQKYYNGFIVTEKPEKIDFQLDFVERKQLSVIYKKKERKSYLSFYEIKNNRHFVTFYQISLIQLQIIIREALVGLLSKNNGFILHASASKVNGRAYLFTGRPGAGKSTAMTLLKRSFVPLADDTVIIREENKTCYLYQTPFIEKEAWVVKNSKKYLIDRVFFLKKSRFFKTEAISNKNYVLSRLVSQFWTEERSKKTQISYLMRFVNSFQGFYFLYFAKKSQELTKLLKNETQNK